MAPVPEALWSTGPGGAGAGSGAQQGAVMTKAVLGVIGGSGVYDMPGLEDVREVQVDSPWGEPSDAFRIGRMGGTEVVFLPRHGRGHRFSPIDINYRANIDAMKRLGVTDIVSVSA